MSYSQITDQLLDAFMSPGCRPAGQCVSVSLFGSHWVGAPIGQSQVDVLVIYISREKLPAPPRKVDGLRQICYMELDEFRDALLSGIPIAVESLFNDDIWASHPAFWELRSRRRVLIPRTYIDTVRNLLHRNLEQCYYNTLSRTHAYHALRLATILGHVTKFGSFPAARDFDVGLLRRVRSEDLSHGQIKRALVQLLTIVDVYRHSLPLFHHPAVRFLSDWAMRIRAGMMV